MPYAIKWDERKDKDYPHGIPNLRGYDLQRLNEKELREEFEENLQTELELVKKLADSDDLTKRAATLATLSNLSNHLFGEDKKEIE